MDNRLSQSCSTNMEKLTCKGEENEVKATHVGGHRSCSCNCNRKNLIQPIAKIVTLAQFSHHRASTHMWVLIPKRLRIVNKFKDCIENTATPMSTWLHVGECSLM